MKVHAALGSGLLESIYRRCPIPVYQSQLLSYLKLAKKKTGLLINFNVRHLRHGIQRFVR